MTPNGLDEIKAMFGDIGFYIRRDGTLDSQWNEQFLERCALPFPLKLSWNEKVTITSILCHKLLVTTFENVFNDIVTQGLRSKVVTFGGCFMFRPQRTSTSKLSTHSWGVAIDLNTLTNEQGTNGDMDQAIIQVFKNEGFMWGGEFLDSKRRDPMHFQYATGY